MKSPIASGTKLIRISFWNHVDAPIRGFVWQSVRFAMRLRNVRTQVFYEINIQMFKQEQHESVLKELLK